MKSIKPKIHEVRKGTHKLVVDIRLVLSSIYAKLYEDMLIDVRAKACDPKRVLYSSLLD